MYDEQTIIELKNRMREIVDAIDVTKETIDVFSADNNDRQQRDDYFIDSAWQVRTTNTSSCSLINKFL